MTEEAKGVAGEVLPALSAKMRSFNPDAKILEGLAAKLDDETAKGNKMPPPPSRINRNHTGSKLSLLHACCFFIIG